MFRKVLVIAIVSACFWAAASSDAQAQRPNRSVSRPTLSPYLNLYRRDIGYMDPRDTEGYNPYLRYFQTDRRARRDVAPTTGSVATPAQSAELMRAIRSQQGQTPAGVAPTGNNGTFMNMGHFYQLRSYRR